MNSEALRGHAILGIFDVAAAAIAWHAITTFGNFLSLSAESSLDVTYSTGTAGMLLMTAVPCVHAVAIIENLRRRRPNHQPTIPRWIVAAYTSALIGVVIVAVASHYLVVGHLESVGYARCQAKDERTRLVVRRQYMKTPLPEFCSE